MCGGGGRGGKQRWEKGFKSRRREKTQGEGVQRGENEAPPYLHISIVSTSLRRSLHIMAHSPARRALAPRRADNNKRSTRRGICKSSSCRGRTLAVQVRQLSALCGAAYRHKAKSEPVRTKFRLCPSFGPGSRARALSVCYAPQTSLQDSLWDVLGCVNDAFPGLGAIGK